MKANARPGAHSEAPGWSSGGGVSPAPRTGKPGQSAHDWSTQGVFPWFDPAPQTDPPMKRKIPVLGAPFLRGKKKAHKHKSFWPVTPPVTGDSPDREARGQSFMYYPRNPRNINLFVRIPDREDRWPGRPEKNLCAQVLCAFSAPYFQSWKCAILCV